MTSAGVHPIRKGVRNAWGRLMVSTRIRAFLSRNGGRLIVGSNGLEFNLLAGRLGTDGQIFQTGPNYQSRSDGLRLYPARPGQRYPAGRGVAGSLGRPDFQQ